MPFTLKKLPCKNTRAIKFEVRGADATFMNAVRRTIASKVKVLAITSVDVTTNTSALYDEVVAHRIGMIPITFDPKSFDGKSKSGSTVKFALSKRGPCTVHASDLKSTDKGVAPVSGKILIVNLLEGQELNLEATAELGTGAQHARWQPAIMGYDQKGTRGEGSAFVVTLESTSGLEPKDVMLAALESLEESLGQLADSL